MRGLGRAVPVALALALVASACTSDPDQEAADTGGDGATGGSTRGLTEDTIRIGVIGVDFGPLAEAGLTPDLGNQPRIFDSVVAGINEDGGIGGRRVEMRHTLISADAGTAEGQAACVEMTQDFEAFAVILTPAISREVARCTAVTNGTLTLGPTGFDEALYEEAEGRLFTAGSDTSMSTDRQAAGWARLLDEEGVLDGATIGVVTDEQAPEVVAAAEDSLIPTLEELGHQVAVDVTLPCPEGDFDCDQHESAVQQMKGAGVDLVFMGAANTVGPTLVQAAENLDFRPQWVANGNQVTDTVAEFFASVSGAWDGTIGTSTVFARPGDLTEQAHECNATVTEHSGDEYEPGSDAFGFAAVICLVTRLVDRAGDAIEPAELDRATIVEEIEGLGEVPLNAGPPGSLAPGKHDAGDHLFIADYRASEGEFVQREGDPVRID